MNGKVRMEMEGKISIHLTVKDSAASSNVPTNLRIMRFLRDELGL